jgi:uncharacterized protein YbbC (DUF1343 family)
VPTNDKNRRVTRAGAVRACGVVCVVVLAASVFAEIDRTRLALIDPLVEDAIGDGLLPGAVVVVGHAGEIVYEGAFGARAVDGLGESMTPDTIFDLASLTKVVATTTSVMILVEEGRLRLRDRVATYLPEFSSHGKERITVEHLLTHVSGLRPDLPLQEVFEGAGAAIARAANEVPEAGPGERFIYSDINFFVLGEIVRLVTGQTLDQFARDRIFRPLGMKDTGFNPPSSLRPRIAPTEPCAPLAWPCGGAGAVMLRGRVHDPTARRMGGVAGHAGLFGTAGDLARFCRMLLGGGTLDDVRILAPLTVARMTRVSTPTHLADRRGLGWDLDSRYSSNRGDLFGFGSYGHTGFTGTSLWLDPASDTFVVFLSSRLHPSGAGDVTALRGRVATVVASAVSDNPAGDSGAGGETPVWTGLDVLREEGFNRLAGAHVGLVTNQTGRARDGATAIDLLDAASGVELVALFSPEHGIRGVMDGLVSSSRDTRTGLPIHSLYTETRRPTTEMLQGIDTLVVDLQDVGARFYTYATTMAYVLEAAAARGLRVMVLDRPNPIGGVDVEGPILDESSTGFTGYFPSPVRHGLTLGELARLFNTERQIGAELEVVAMRGWRRETWFDQTGLRWVDPSPNMRNLHQVLLYPGIGAIEGSNLSVGRGTDTPFEQIGAPWIDGPELAGALNRRRLPGVRVYPLRFRPSSSRFAGELCEGVFFIVTDRDAVRPVRLGLEVAAALHRLYGDQFDLDAVARLLGSRDTLARIRAGDPPWAIAAGWAEGEAAWRRVSASYFLYD